MDTQAFEAQLQRDGYLEVRRKSMDPGVDTTPHHHDFDTRLMVVEGRLTVVCGDRETTCGPGDVFELARGVEHFERYGPGPYRVIAGVRHPVAAS